MTAQYQTPGVANLEALGITVSAAQINAGGGAALVLTPSTAVATDVAGAPISSSTTDVELGYVHGLTSSAQTQLNGKLKNWVAVPATADAAGAAGDIAHEAGFLYVCTASGTWERVATATWS
jgi:hypothetical protein